MNETLALKHLKASMAFKSGAVVTSRGHNFSTGSMLSLQIHGSGEVDEYIINLTAAKQLLALRAQEISRNYLSPGKISRVSSDLFFL